MSPARLLVRAVVVADGRSSRLPDVLAALAAQTVRPDLLHILQPAGAERPEAPGGLAPEWHDLQGEHYGASVDALLSDQPAHAHELLWLLHDDTAPAPDALALLLATAKKRTAAAVVAPAQVRWDDTSRLISVGTTTSRVGARRIDLVDEDDINQGQHDDLEDVLAASVAGALVRRDAWEELGGLEPAYRGFGASLHLCRLAWRAGYDVVVVPTALMRHAQDGLDGLRSGGGRRRTYGRRRSGEWLHALAWAPLPWVPVLVLWAFVSAAARAMLRIAQNEARMVGADLAVPWRVLALLPRVPGIRRRIRRVATRPRSAVRPFLVGWRGTASFVRSREMRAYDRWRAIHAPADLVAADLAATGVRRRTALGAVTLVSVAVAVLVHGTWIRAVAGGRMLAGPAPGVTDASLPYLWERTWSGWAADGVGAALIDGGFAALLLPAAALPGGTRLWLGLLLGGSVVIAALSAWFASGTLTRSLWARALVALAYALWPWHLQAASDGRLGPVIAHLMLPWFAMGLTRAAAWHRGEAVGDGAEHPPQRTASPSAAMGAAFSMAVATVAAPVLLAPLLVVVVVAGAVAGRSRWRVWGIGVPALVVAGPALVAAWQVRGTPAQAWAILAREPGPALASPVVEPWRLILGLTGQEEALPGVGLPAAVAAGALGALVIAAALAALVSGRAPAAVGAGLGIAALGLATAVVAQRSVVMGGDASGDVVNGFAGPGTSLALVGLLAAVCAASFRVWDAGAGRRRAYIRLASSLAIVAACGVIAMTVVVEAWPGRAERGDVHPAAARVLPLVATLEQDLPTRQRVMVLTDTDQGLDYALLEADGSIAIAGRAGGGPAGEVPEADGAIAAAVTGLAGASATALEPLAAWGVGVLVAAPGSTTVDGALSQMTGLQLIGGSEYGTSYRVPRPAGEAPVSRAWIERGTADVTVLDSDSFSGAAAMRPGAAGTLVIAAPAAPGWTAAADGVRLDPVDDAFGRAAFAVPAGARDVSYEHRQEGYRAWWWAAAAVVAWTMVGMLPLHDRRRQVVRA